MAGQGFMGPPPAIALLWLGVALVPISALFSALSLAIAAFARSSKEGQYYLMPLLLVSLPLMMIPMLPSSELNVGTSLIPVTGVMLLLRSLIEGQYFEALRYLPLVAGVTTACCLLAVRWATDQFNNESVLFRESERFSVGMWVRHLVRDRDDTPSVAEALFCGVLLLVIRFFASFSVGMPASWGEFVATTVVLQVALIATPACLMAIMLTRKPAATLLLRRPSFAATVPAAALLAVLFHPAMLQAAHWIQTIYPISEETMRALAPIERLMSDAPLWQVLLLAALTPAICEELAFRGFILSGLRRMGHKWGAIVLCSVFFGLAHSLLQQSLSACLVGIVIGYIAVKTGSLLPAAMYHMFHNGLSLLHSRVTMQTLEQSPLLRYFLEPAAEGGAIGYSLPAALLMAALGIGLLMWFKRLPYRASDEERLQQALDHQAPALALPAARVKRLA
jgi:sodium transport system permease protein